MPTSTIERAFALARSGECRTMDELKHQLRRERLESVDFHLGGKLTRAQLTGLMALAPAHPKAEPAPSPKSG